MIYIITTGVLGMHCHRLAKRWPTVCKRWYEKELIFRSYPYKTPEVNPSRALTQMTSMGVMIAILDQTIYIARKYDQAKINMKICGVDVDQSVLYQMFARERSHFFSVVEFRAWMAPFFELQYLVLVMYWSLTNSFLIDLSMWLIFRLRQLLERIQWKVKHEVQPEWEEVYQHFNILVDLIADVDREVGGLSLLNCLHHLLFLCFYLFKVTR